MAVQTKRPLIGTREAAEILGVSQCRVRQLTLAGPNGEPPQLWSEHIGQRSIVVDQRQVEKLRDVMAERRAQGKVRGPQPGGFKPDRPGIAKKAD